MNHPNACIRVLTVPASLRCLRLNYFCQTLVRRNPSSIFLGYLRVILTDLGGKQCQLAVPVSVVEPNPQFSICV